MGYRYGYKTDLLIRVKWNPSSDLKQFSLLLENPIILNSPWWCFAGGWGVSIAPGAGAVVSKDWVCTKTDFNSSSIFTKRLEITRSISEMEEWGGLYPCKCSLLVAVRRGKIPLAVSAAQPPSLIYARGSRGLMAAEKGGEKADGWVSSKDTLANSERDQCHAQTEACGCCQPLQYENRGDGAGDKPANT